MQSAIKSLKNKNLREKGFTVVELLVVIIVIAILATIVVTSYGGVRQNAADTKRDSDLKSLEDAIELARANTSQTLHDITGGNGVTSWLACAFNDNPSPQVEPSQLATSTNCWQDYYTALDDIGTAAKTDLSDLKKGDARGNPYIIDEREGVSLSNHCRADFLGYFTGSAASYVYNYISVPFSLSECL